MTAATTTASYSLLAYRPSKLLPYFAISIGAHVLLVVVWLTVSWLLAGPAVDIDQKPIKATLVRQGKPRDEKLLPRKEEPPPPPAKPEPEAVKVPVPTPAAVPIPSKDAKPDKKQAPDTRKSLFDALNKTAKPTPDEKEGEADGDPNGDSAKQEGEKYFALMVSLVKRNYDVSDTIPEAERRTLHTVVWIKVGTSGELLGSGFRKESPNPLFNDAVMTSIKRTAPFPPPPSHLRDQLKSIGVAFDFTP